MSTNGRGKIKLLVVDDDQANRYFKAHVLRQTGYQVLEAATGTEALRTIEDEEPTLVLMDVKLPDISGIAVTKRVKASQPDTFVLQTSAAKTAGRDRAAGLSGGADAYLVEPIDPEELIATVGALLRLAAAESQLRAANKQLELMLSERTVELKRAREEAKAEAAKRELAESALRHAEKLDALGQLTGGVAHDFNNLLTVILGGIDFVERRRLDPSIDQARIDRYLANARQAAKDCAKLTRQLLSFARRAPAEVEPVKVNATIGDIKDMLRTALGVRYPIVHDFSPDVGIVNLDRGQFEAALLNLTINARDAMPGSGEVRITTAKVRVTSLADLQPANIVLGGAVMPQTFVRISVTDAGVGMAPDVVNHVFEPFFTTKEVGKGSGLGLSQVYGFVQQSKGLLAVQTAPGKGTTVHLLLPEAQPLSSALNARDETNDVPRGSETILIVEDNERVREGSAAMFADLGYKVLEAGDGWAALAVLQERPGVALLFSDIVMPNKMSGVELAVSARILRPNIRVLLTTGYAREAQWAQSAAHEFPVLHKPYGQRELAQRIREVLAADRQP